MVSCNQHDYLEIICMFHYEVAVHTVLGERVTGEALDVKLDNTRSEVLMLKTENSDVQEVSTDSIRLIEVLTPVARFSRVEF